jgi:hypothetical protein
MVFAIQHTSNDTNNLQRISTMSHTLDTNVNVMKARIMLGTVSGATCVDSSLLLEDDGF